MDDGKYYKELQRIVEDKHYCEVLAKLSVKQEELQEAEHDLRLGKLAYDYKFVNLCTSNSYLKQYKTIKQREQMAALELNNIRRDNILLQNRVDFLKGEVRILDWQLRFLLKEEGDA